MTTKKRSPSKQARFMRTAKMRRTRKALGLKADVTVEADKARATGVHNTVTINSIASPEQTKAISSALFKQSILKSLGFGPSHADTVAKVTSADLLKAWQAVRVENGDYLLPGHKVEGYKSLEGVLFRAYQQAAVGKGSERHGRGLTFEEQPTQVISDLLDSDAGLAFQAIKKVNEGMRLEHEPKIKEMLGAINYIASIVIRMERNKK